MVVGRLRERIPTSSDRLFMFLGLGPRADMIAPPSVGERVAADRIAAAGRLLNGKSRLDPIDLGVLPALRHELVVSADLSDAISIAGTRASSAAASRDQGHLSYQQTMLRTGTWRTGLGIRAFRVFKPRAVHPGRGIMASGKVIGTDEEAKWLSQWKAADSALHEQHVSELRQLTPTEAWSAIEAVLTFPVLTRLPEERRLHSGLVELQTYLHKLQVK